jgi:hypothetical protein
VAAAADAIIGGRDRVRDCYCTFRVPCHHGGGAASLHEVAFDAVVLQLEHILFNPGHIQQP